jgi:hypothetical protein
VVVHGGDIGVFDKKSAHDFLPERKVV